MVIQMTLDEIEGHRRTLGNTIIASNPPCPSLTDGIVGVSKEKQGAPRKYWCFTLNNYLPTDPHLLETLMKHEVSWYIFQEEVGESGTPHLQGAIALLREQRLSALKKWNPKIHWQPAKSATASMTYCQKYQSGTGNLYSYGVEIPPRVRTLEPRGWQLQVMALIKDEPDLRTIHWFWEPTGQVGKTTLCKYLVVNHDALILSGKSNDMYHILAKFPHKRNLILVDVPRRSYEYVNYAAIENIKNGLICSGKYDGTQLAFNCPHVIVFANEPPQRQHMSEDRWNIVRINPND